jgi:hypothetical protein
MGSIVDRRPNHQAPRAPQTLAEAIGHRFFDHLEHLPDFDAVRYLTVELETFDDVDVRQVLDTATGAYGTMITPHHVAPPRAA